MKENKQLEEILKLHPLAHKPISSKRGWNKDYLYENLDRMRNVKGYAERLKKDAFDIGAGEDICEIAFGKAGDDVYYNMLTPQLTRRLAKNIDEDNRDEMAKYTIKHLDSVLDIFKDEEMYDAEGSSGLILEIPIYKIDKKGHDRAVDAIYNFRAVSEIAEKKDIRKMKGIVANKLRDPEMPKWAVKFASVAMGNEKFIQLMYGGIIQEAAYFVQKELTDDNGKTDGEKIRKMIKDSIAEADWEFREERDPKDHGDAWKANLRPLATIADHAYGALRREYYEDVEAEKDKSERAARRHRKRMDF